MSRQWPPWLAPLADAAASIGGDDLSRFLPPDDGSGRPSAVLIAFADGPDGPSVLLIERSSDLRKHAGQVAFPGGSIDDGDASPIAAALREATEEVGLDAAGVQVGYLSPGFEVRELFVWGFTAGLLDRLIDIAGWAQPWDRTLRRPLPPLPGYPGQSSGPSSAAVDRD